MSEKQFLFLLAVIGVVVFTAWVVHQSKPIAPMLQAHHAATTRPTDRAGGASGLVHPRMVKPASTACVEVVVPTTVPSAASSRVSLVAIPDCGAAGNHGQWQISHAATMRALGLGVPVGYKRISGDTSVLLAPSAAAQSRAVGLRHNGLDFDAVDIPSTQR